MLCITIVPLFYSVCENGVFNCSEPIENCVDEVICAHESQIYMFKDFERQRRCGTSEITTPTVPSCGCPEHLVMSPTVCLIIVKFN